MNIRDLTRPYNFEDFKSRYQREPVEELIFGNKIVTQIKPQISVMIRTYNHYDYIRQALDSVLSQKINVDFEILLGDDESNDGTREVCIEYAKRYPEKIRLFLHKRKNNIVIYNKITPTFMFSYNLYNCRGKYVALLCGDDYWSDEFKLQKQFDFLESRPEAALCYHSLKRVEVRESGEEVEGDLVENHYYTNCTLFRNRFEYLPQPMFETLNEDIFIYHLSKCTGSEHYLNNISPTVQRNQYKGIWFSKKDELYKTKFRILTAVKLLETFKSTIKKEEYSWGLYYHLIKGWQNIKYVGDDDLSKSTKFKFFWFLWKHNMLLRYLGDKNKVE